MSNTYCWFVVSCCCFISSSKNLKVISLVLEFTNSSKVCEVSTRSASFLERLEFRSSTSSTDYNKENKKKMWNWNQISSKTISVICIHIYNSLDSNRPHLSFTEFHNVFEWCAKNSLFKTEFFAKVWLMCSSALTSAQS